MSKETQNTKYKTIFCTTQLLLDISNLPFFQSSAFNPYCPKKANIGKTLDIFTILYKL